MRIAPKGLEEGGGLLKRNLATCNITVALQTDLVRCLKNMTASPVYSLKTTCTPYGNFMILQCAMFQNVLNEDVDTYLSLS